MENQDVIAIARENGEALVQILFIRNGKLIGSDSRMLDNAEEETDGVILEQFITQFYSDAGEIPSELVLPAEVEQTRIIERWLRDKRNGSKVSITVPQRGDKRNLIKLANEYIEKKDYNGESRFDIVTVLDSPNGEYLINHIEDAFYPLL